MECRKKEDIILPLNLTVRKITRWVDNHDKCCNRGTECTIFAGKGGKEGDIWGMSWKIVGVCQGRGGAVISEETWTKAWNP